MAGKAYWDSEGRAAATATATPQAGSEGSIQGVAMVGRPVGVAVVAARAGWKSELTLDLGVNLP